MAGTATGPRQTIVTHQIAASATAPSTSTRNCLLNIRPLR